MRQESVVPAKVFRADEWSSQQDRLKTTDRQGFQQFVAGHGSGKTAASKAGFAPDSSSLGFSQVNVAQNQPSLIPRHPPALAQHPRSILDKGEAAFGKQPHPTRHPKRQASPVGCYKRQSGISGPPEPENRQGRVDPDDLEVVMLHQVCHGAANPTPNIQHSCPWQEGTPG